MHKLDFYGKEIILEENVLFSDFKTLNSESRRKLFIYISFTFIYILETRFVKQFLFVFNAMLFIQKSHLK